MLIIEKPSGLLINEIQDLLIYIQENQPKEIPEQMQVQNLEQRTPVQSPIREANTQITSRQTKI